METIASLVTLLITAPVWIVLGALTIALGLRWGGMWLLKAIAKEAEAKESEIERWLKRIFNPTER